MRRLHLTAIHIIHNSLTNCFKSTVVLSLLLLPLSPSHAQTSLGVKEGAGIVRDSNITTNAIINESGLIGTGEDPFSTIPFAGAVRVRTAELTEQGDCLLLTMELRVNEEALNKRQSYAIVPQLIREEGDNLTQITFPYALVNGSIREKLYKRKLNFGNEELLANLPVVRTNISRRAHGDVILYYTVQVLYEPWMDLADLKLHAILVSPAGKRQLLSVENVGRVKFSPRAPYEMQAKVNFTEPAPEHRQWKMQGQAHLDFQVGRSVIIPSFRRNPEELAKIASAVAGVRSHADAKITGLSIAGYASPEGSYATNDKLARGRSEALRDYMVKEYGLDRELFRVNSVAEDWDGLRALVQESALTDTQKQSALAVIDDNDEPDRKEARLRTQTAAWKLMIADMFPQLRRVEYQMLSQRELYLLAMSYPEDSKERDEIFDLIARLYPNEAVSMMNAAALMLSRGELTGAKRMLDKVESDSRASNNLGVYYLMTGELEKAEPYLAKAVTMGIPEAVTNMEELKKKQEDKEKMKRYQR